MRGWRAATGVCGMVLWSLGASSIVLAQVGAGALTGVVSDPAGAVVPGAVVTVTAVSTNLSRETVTGADGRYSMPGLASGAYRVHVELSGFKPLTQDGIGVATGETVRVD